MPPRYRKPRPEGHPRKANNELVSRTDPEATVISRRGFDLHLAYKAHLAVAGKRGQVITAAVAITGAKADEHLLGEVLWHHHRLSRLPIRDVVADAKYGTMANYLYLHHAGLRAFIPPRQHKRGPRGVWRRDHFRYLSDEDVFVCAAGMRMKRFTKRTSTRCICYRVEKGACAVCRFRNQCMPSGRERTISRFFDQELVEAALERMASPMGQKLLHERRVRAEGVFALAKELHGLRRTRFKGRRKVQVQLWLTAAAMNIKRAVGTLKRLAPTKGAAQVTIPRDHSQGLIRLACFGRQVTASVCRLFIRSGYPFGNTFAGKATWPLENAKASTRKAGSNLEQNR